MSAHHPSGPSTHLLRLACPGSRAAEAPLWEEPDTEDEDTRAGNERHRVAHRGLARPSERPALLAELPTGDQVIVEAWWSFWDLARSNATRVIAGGAEARIGLPGDRSGTADAWLLTDSGGQRCLIVGDLKGQPRSAKWDLQIADYASGLLMEHGPVDSVTLAIVSRAGLDVAVVDPAHIERQALRIAQLIGASMREDAPRRPGDHCARCRASAACDVRRQLAAQTAALVPTMGDPVAALVTMDPAARTELLDRLDLAIDRLGEAQKAIKEAIREGKIDVPGYRVTPSTRQEWANPAEARLALLAAAREVGKDAEELTPLVSPTKARSLLGAGVVDPLTERRAGTPSVRRVKGAA